MTHPHSIHTHRCPDHVPDVVQHEALPVHREPEAACAPLHQGLGVIGHKGEDLAVEGLGHAVGAAMPSVLGRCGVQV